MTNEQAIAELQKEHDLIQGEHELDGSQFAPALLEALALAIEALNHSEIPNTSEPKCADGCIYGWGSSECGHCDYRSEDVLKALPPAQPERKTWKWIPISDGYVDIYECNQCGDTEDHERNYCPNCGADMR